jgi:hypothetical protein
MWIFMIGSIIGLFISEIIQWVIVSFRKNWDSFLNYWYCISTYNSQRKWYNF